MYHKIIYVAAACALFIIILAAPHSISLQADSSNMILPADSLPPGPIM